MNLTYFVMIEMLEATHDLRGRIVGEISRFVNMDDYLSSDNLDTTRLFFNENAAKGVSAYLSEVGDDLKILSKIVAIPEEFSIFDFEDEPIEDFEDVIDIFPNKDARYNHLTGEFKRKTDTLKVDSVESKPIVFERAANIVKDLSESVSDKSELADTSIVANQMILDLLPTSDTLKEIIHARLDIEDDNEFSEVIISQSESSLAIMQTLMSDDLAEVEDMNVESINRKILPKIESSKTTDSYLQSEKVLNDFIEEVRLRESEIRSEYQRNLDEYIAQVVKEVEAEYRRKVPDLTEQNVQNFYAEVSEEFVSKSDARDQAKKALKDEIIHEFVSSDRSPAMKALKKFLTLKEQIKQSAIAAIIRVKQREMMKSIEIEADHRNDRRFESHQSNRQVDADSSRLEENVTAEANLENQSAQSDVEEIEDSKEIAHNSVESLETLDDKEVVEESHDKIDENKDLSETSEQIAETSDEESDVEESIPLQVSEDAEQIDLQSLFADETEDNDSQETEEDKESEKTDGQSEEDMSIEHAVEVSTVDLSMLSEDEEENQTSKKSKKSGSRRRKMGLGAKIGIGVASVLAIGALTFGTIVMFNGSKNDATTSQSTTSSSAIVGDTIFNVGDTLTITGQDGSSLDVTIKEFKEDGSAVAVDANEDLWLIAADQMKEYADAHPEQFETTNSSSSSSETNGSSESTSSSSTESSGN